MSTENGHANGNGHANTRTPDIAKIRGPLGIRSASLAGKVVLVTGSGRGIGREMALELGRRGAKVVVNYAHSSDAADEVVAEIKKNGSDAVAFKANVSVVKDITSLFSQAVAHFGKLNIVCSNSGVVSFGHIKDVTEEEYDRVMSINTRGQFFVTREAYKHLSIDGRLKFMGSITGQAKGVHAVCTEYIPRGDTLNDDEVDEYASTWSPLHRVGLPIDIARVVCFLVSQDGEWINGKILGIGGAACM